MSDGSGGGWAGILDPRRRLRSSGRISNGRTADYPPELELEYQSYRRAQAEAFLRLVPPDRVRPLYGVAREWAKEHGHYDRRSPMTALVAFLLERLPLPPLHFWAADRAAHPLEHLVARGQSGGETHASTEPLEVRRLEADSGIWRVGLHLFQEDLGWKGYMSFRSIAGIRRRDRGSSPAERSLYRTANVFADSDPHLIQQTFQHYEPSTLEAFLRSVLP